MNLNTDKNFAPKVQQVFNNYEEFLDKVDMSDRIVMIMTYNFEDSKNILNNLMIKLKSSNARIHNFKIEQRNQSISNVLSIIDFMDKHNIDTIIGIGEDFLADLIKSISVLYENRDIDTLHKLEENKMVLKYGRLKESVFILTTGGGSESHRYFKLIGKDRSQVTVFEDFNCKIDKIVIDPKIARTSSVECTIHYLFSTISNLLDIIFKDNVPKDDKLIAKDLLSDTMTLLENGDKFGLSLLYREKVLECSSKASELIDKFGYGVLYLYGNLLESIFGIPRYAIDILGIEFLMKEMKKKYSLMYISSYVNINEDSFYIYKTKYGVNSDVLSCKIDRELFDKVKKLSYNFLCSNSIIDNYRSLEFNEKMNDDLFEYYLNGVNLD